MRFACLHRLLTGFDRELNGVRIYNRDDRESEDTRIADVLDRL